MSTHSGSPRSAVVIEKIAESLAEARGGNIEELPPIGRSLDPEALARLINTTTVPTTVIIELYGCRVKINDSGDVTTTDSDGTT